MSLLDELRSRLQYKIIIPFLLLTLLVALTGSGLALLFITSDAQERLTNNLAQLARSSSDSIVQIERANLAFLREIAFAQANPASGAPAVADAVLGGDRVGLARALDPYRRVSGERGVRIDRLIVFDRAGRTLFDREASDTAMVQLPGTAGRDLSGLWFVPAILASQQDQRGDKFAGLLELDGKAYLYTVAPIADAEGAALGGVIAATELDSLIQDVARRAQLIVLTVYRPDTGVAFASTLAGTADLPALTIRPELLEQARTLQQERREQGLLDSVRINEREYQLAYAPLSVRGAVVGLVSVGLAGDYVLGPWSNARLPLALLTAVLMTAIIVLGIAIARQITRPLTELVTTAEAVIDGNLERRSSVTSIDEVGVLAGSFNAMTAHLLELYRVVQAEADQRAAIFESIADGIVVTSADGTVLMGNPALRRLLELDADAPLPAHLNSIPLQPLGETVLSFGDSATGELYQLGERVVRLIRSPIRSERGPGGVVVVFQDLTAEVTVDRAKTNFIATISHELRTPLTVISGSVDLILNGYVGAIPDTQRELLDSVRRYTGVTTALMNNMITVAKLDSGTMPIELAPQSVAELLQAPLRSFQRAAAAKGLTVTVDTPLDLPPVLADAYAFRLAVEQLLDNAQRYTAQGGVTIRARAEHGALRFDLCDTGPGIEPALQQQLFVRFSRGTQGINSTERGIGLGLAIARELLALQGGQLWLATTSEHGTTFSFTLPQPALHSYDEAQAAQAATIS